MQSEPRAQALRLRAIPIGRTERIVGTQLETRVIGFDAVLRAVPLDVAVRIEMARHRGAAESREKIRIRGSRSAIGAVVRGRGGRCWSDPVGERFELHGVPS